MPQTKEQRQEPPPPTRGNTEISQDDKLQPPRPKAREPYERDESADSQGADASEIRRMGEIAHAAAESGQKDTTRGEELDATYQKVRESADPAPVDKRNQNQRPR